MLHHQSGKTVPENIPSDPRTELILFLTEYCLNMQQMGQTQMAFNEGAHRSPDFQSFSYRNLIQILKECLTPKVTQPVVGKFCSFQSGELGKQLEFACVPFIGLSDCLMS